MRLNLKNMGTDNIISQRKSKQKQRASSSFPSFSETAILSINTFSSFTIITTETSSSNDLELIALIALEIIVYRFLGDLLVVLLHGGEVLSGFAELALFHSLSDVPVHEGPLSVHEIEFVVHSAHYLGDGGGV